MITILLDRNMEGLGALLWGMLAVEEWIAFFHLKVVAVGQVLPDHAADRLVWRFAQEHDMLLLTNKPTIETIIRAENFSSSLPVLTIVQAPLLTSDRSYQETCLDNLLEILENLESYRGTGRLFIPW